MSLYRQKLHSLVNIAVVDSMGVLSSFVFTAIVVSDNKAEQEAQLPLREHGVSFVLSSYHDATQGIWLFEL